MNIVRGPRKDRGFTIVDNDLAQNNDLSLGARGLAIYILSLPPGAQADIKSLAARVPEGRQAIAQFMRELEAARYLVRTTTRGERGRFRTVCTMHEEPQAEENIPDSVAKPWSHASTRRDAPDTASSQVGPNPGPPDSGGPASSAPAPGDTGSTPKGVKEPVERTTPQPPVDGPAVPPDRRGGGDASLDENAATALVDSLPYAGRLPGRKTRETLIRRVADALRAGWSEKALRSQLTTGTAGAKSLAHVYGYRLQPDQLPDPRTVARAAAADATPTPAPYVPEQPREVASAAEGAARVRAMMRRTSRGRDHRPYVPTV